MAAHSIIHNAKIATNGTPAFVQALAIEGGVGGHDQAR